METSSLTQSSQVFDADLLLRLKNYLKVLRIFAVKGRTDVSIFSLAEQQGIDGATVQHDFSLLGFSDGVREIFNVSNLIYLLSNSLGYYRVEEACLVGCGRLARSILANSAFSSCNIRIVAAFDVNPLLVHTEIAGVKVLDTLHFNDMIQRMNVVMAIMATPSGDVLRAAELICCSPIKMIWNFTHRAIEAPFGMVGVNSSLASDICADYNTIVSQYRNLASGLLV